MPDNPYLRDAPIFLGHTATLLCSAETRETVPLALSSAAFGCERLVKAVLWELNPVYVLKDGAFSNSVPVLHAHTLRASARGSGEIKAQPDADVLTFRVALLRGRCVCEVTDRHAAALHFLSSARDIVAHCDLALLDPDKARRFLLRDFYCIVKDYADRFEQKADIWLAGRFYPMADLAAKHQDEPSASLAIKTSAAKKKWAELRGVKGYTEKMRSKTAQAVRQKTNSNRVFATTACPACEQEAVLFVELDSDEGGGGNVLLGAYPRTLQCLFCKLNLDDYNELRELKLDDEALALARDRCGQAVAATVAEASKEPSGAGLVTE